MPCAVKTQRTRDGARVHERIDRACLPTGAGGSGPYDAGQAQSPNGLELLRACAPASARPSQRSRRPLPIRRDPALAGWLDGKARMLARDRRGEPTDDRAPQHPSPVPKSPTPDLRPGPAWSPLWSKIRGVT